MKKYFSRAIRANEFYLFLVLIIVAILIQIRSGEFFTATNLVSIANAMVVPGLFGLTTFMVLVSGGIDVSFPALASLAVYATTRMLVDAEYQGGIWLPFIIAISLGILLGAFNGFFVSRFAVPSLIITLGTASVFSGFMQGALNSVQIPIIPSGMRDFGNSVLFVAEHPVTGITANLPVSFLFFVLITLGVFLLMRYTTFGRGIYAVGGDPSVALRSGFKVKQIRFWLYVLVGAIAAIAGLIRTSMMGQMHPTNLLGMELMIIAAVVLGGTAITGGTGTITGVILGTLLIVIVQNSMILVGIPTIWQRVSLGALIIVGTGISAYQLKQSGRDFFTKRRKAMRREYVSTSVG